MVHAIIILSENFFERIILDRQIISLWVHDLLAVVILGLRILLDKGEMILRLFLLKGRVLIKYVVRDILLNLFFIDRLLFLLIKYNCFGPID